MAAGGARAKIIRTGMKARQLPLPLSGGTTALSRENFIAAPANTHALAFIERWPDWTSRFAAIYGPSGSGKTHLATIWAKHAGASFVKALDLTTAFASSAHPLLVVEDVDAAPPTREHDAALFALFEKPGQTLLLTGRAPPPSWPLTLADLSSRFASLLAFPVWTPDDTLLTSLAAKLFEDRQLRVSEQVISRVVARLERTPAAIRDFVAEADAKALAERRPVSERLVLEMLEPAS
jgi:chromosomal replication initiation ATPase DnaA